MCQWRVTSWTLDTSPHQSTQLSICPSLITFLYANQWQIREKCNKPFILTIRHNDIHVRGPSCAEPHILCVSWNAETSRGVFAEGSPGWGEEDQGQVSPETKPAPRAAGDGGVQRAPPGRRLLTPAAAQRWAHPQFCSAGKGTEMQREKERKKEWKKTPQNKPKSPSPAGRGSPSARRRPLP